MTSEPLTVEELERQLADHILIRYGKAHPASELFEKQTHEIAQELRLLVESHSRQLWLEAPWISVSERLPESNGEYFASRRCRPQGWVTTYTKQAGWIADERNYPVTHWMPLPNSPKAESTPKPSPAGVEE